MSASAILTLIIAVPILALLAGGMRTFYIVGIIVLTINGILEMLAIASVDHL